MDRRTTISTAAGITLTAAALVAAVGVSRELGKIAFEIEFAVRTAGVKLAVKTDHTNSPREAAHPKRTVHVADIDRLIAAGQVDLAGDAFEPDLAVCDDLEI